MLAQTLRTPPYWLGLDFGTSGARAIAIDAEARICHQSRIAWTAGAVADPQQWRTTLWQLLRDLPDLIKQGLQAIAIDGTSGTVMLCDRTGEPRSEVLLYNDKRAASLLPELQAAAPAQHLVQTATSSLAKALWLQQHSNSAEISAQVSTVKTWLLHQADWLSFLLHGQLGLSDYHNALKLGYDTEQLVYPDWLLDLATEFQLPHVLVPGDVIAPIQAAIAQTFQVNPDCVICAGTTDSNAAFLASPARSPGEA
ncbi:MAG: FGGY family carbohydrate kinase, partial [Cyanobacteria bacterium P01_H01_bin.121]